MPDIGGDEVEVTEILVKVGDTVTAEQSLITVEGDKASMEVPAPFAGTVKEIKINTGDKVSTGSLIMIFEVAGAAPAAAPAQAAAPAPAAAPAAGGAKDVNVPDIGGDEVEVTEVMVKVGDKVAAEQSLITVEGDKASMEVPAPFAGTVKDQNQHRRQSVYGLSDHGLRSGRRCASCRCCTSSCRCTGSGG